MAPTSHRPRRSRAPVSSGKLPNSTKKSDLPPHDDDVALWVAEAYLLDFATLSPAKRQEMRERCAEAMKENA